MKANDHISDQVLNRYTKREADAAEILRIQTHLSACDGCRNKLAFVAGGAEQSFAAARESFAFEETSDELEHLTYEQLEFYLDHKLDDVTKEIVESHLAFCGECERDLQDLIRYREIAQTAPAVKNETVAAEPGVSFWKKLFALDSIGAFAPVAAVVLIAVLLGAWFLLRGNRGNEIAGINQNQNAVPVNFNAVGNVSVSDPAPETLPAPPTSPENTALPKTETLYALNDGNLKLDERGNLQGAERLSPATRDLVKRSVQDGKISVTNNSLGGANGVLMGERDAGNGVPFGLETPVGKVIRENRPLLRWKPSKDAASYSAAIVDDKFRVVEQSGELTRTSWQPSKPLPRGANYSWQVTAISADGTATVSPASPAPQARFRVIEQNLYDEINRLEMSGARPPNLALGVLYAKAGMKREARAAFERLVKDNPNSPLARRLLQSIRQSQ